MTQQSRVLSAKKEVASTDAAAVASQLAGLVQELQQPGQDGGSPPSTRTKVMNIVVRALDTENAEKTAETIGHLSALYPSRTLILVSQPEATETTLDASVSAHCHLHPEAREVICFEQVLLWARGASAHHLASIAGPLLVSDLPVFLWWLGAPPAEDESLLTLCDRLLVDSADFTDPFVQLAKLSQLISSGAAGKGRATLRDFTWARLAPWRELLAQFFDGPETLPYLARLTEVSIAYSTDPGGTSHAAQPLLLAGWLAAKLNWRPSAVATRAHLRDYHLTFYGAHVPISVQVIPRARAGDTSTPGDLLSVELSVARQDLEASFSVTKTPDGQHAITRAHLPELRDVTRTVILEHPSLLDLLRGELTLLKEGRSFEESLGVMAGFLQ